MWYKVSTKNILNISELYIKSSLYIDYTTVDYLYKSTLDNKYYISDRLPPMYKMVLGGPSSSTLFLSPKNELYNGHTLTSFDRYLFYSDIINKWVGYSTNWLQHPVNSYTRYNGSILNDASYFYSNTKVGVYTPVGGYADAGYTLEVTEVVTPVDDYPSPLYRYWVSDTLLGEYTPHYVSGSFIPRYVGWAKLHIVGSDGSEFYALERPLTYEQKEDSTIYEYYPYYTDITNNKYALFYQEAGGIYSSVITPNGRTAPDPNVGYWIGPYGRYDDNILPLRGTYTRVYTGTGTPPEPASFEVTLDSYVASPPATQEILNDQKSYWIEEI